MTRAFSTRTVGVAILGGILSLSRHWLPAVFERLGDVGWGGGFLIVAGVEIAADLVVVLAAAIVFRGAAARPGGLQSAGAIERLAVGAAVAVVTATVLQRFLPYSLLDPIYTPVFVLRAVGLTALVGSLVAGRLTATAGSDPAPSRPS